MVPLCADCQHNLKTGIDTRKVLHQQQKLIETISAQADANLRVAADLKRLSAVGELFDNIELQLKETAASINESTTSSLTNAVSALSRKIENIHTVQSTDKSADELASIKNHLTGLLNISMKSTKQHINDYVEDLTKDLSGEMKKICSEVQMLSSLTIDMAAHCSDHNASHPHDALSDLQSVTSSFSEEILSEIKSLTTVVSTLEAKIVDTHPIPAESPPNLLQELTEKESHCTLEKSGWRSLGSKNVWRSDWTEYDTRQLRRAEQQKTKDKAIRRRRKNKRQQQYSNVRNNPNNNTTTKNFNANYGNRDTPRKAANDLPSDRVLLAAAKEKFSKPPRQRTTADIAHRPIQFQRGEILNPNGVYNGHSQLASDRQPHLMFPGCSSNAAVNGIRTTDDHPEPRVNRPCCCQCFH